LGLPRRLTSS